MNYQDYITIDPNKRGGKPCVRGVRITVYEVLEYLASDMTEEEILDDLLDRLLLRIGEGVLRKRGECDQGGRKDRAGYRPGEKTRHE